MSLHGSIRAGVLLLVLLSSAVLPDLVRADRTAAVPADGEKTFMVDKYRFEPVGEASEKQKEIGLSLCGSRCNSISASMGNYLKPRGWRLIKTASGVERRVDLDNPFLQGECVCVGDEYRIDWFDAVEPENRAGNIIKQQ